MKKNFVFLIIALVAVITCTGQKQNELSPKDFKSQMKANVTILDVRTPSEFNSGHLEKAVNIDIRNSQFESKAEQLDKSKTVLIYCLSGARSANAAKILRKKGFLVQELKGGMSAWQDEGLPVVK